LNHYPTKLLLQNTKRDDKYGIVRLALKSQSKLLFRTDRCLQHYQNEISAKTVGKLKGWSDFRLANLIE
jgi:hypothetical protein